MKPAKLRKSDTEVNVLLDMGREDANQKLNVDRRQIDNLKYIFDMLQELRLIAKSTKEDSLVYYLEMAAMEASDICDAIQMRQDAEPDRRGQ